MGMDRKQIYSVARIALVSAWSRFEYIYGPTIGDVPELLVNTRTWRTAGRAWLAENKIDISAKLFVHHANEFQRVTIPHEAAHFVAWRLFGDGGHGKAWKRVMVDYGLEPNPYHNMEIPK
jgi:predicted SprT family Zn-dependent metalloprotease